MHTIDPDMVTFDGWALNQLLRRAYDIEHQNRVVCVVDIGASKTTTHILVDHKPTLTHVAQCGGDDITRAIAAQYNLSFDDAEKAKVDGSFLITQTHIESGTPTFRRPDCIFKHHFRRFVPSTSRNQTSFDGIQE
jgi:Ethanolamine utilization protein EutJ (predicted chaperonin)